jgi:hypothetical protein
MLPALVGIPFTTANKAALDQLVGPTTALQIIGKPADLNILQRLTNDGVPAEFHSRVPASVLLGSAPFAGRGAVAVFQIAQAQAW